MTHSWMPDAGVPVLPGVHSEALSKSLAGGVHVHSVLVYHGGAARVANLLRRGLLEAGVSLSASCEINDAGVGAENGVFSERCHPQSCLVVSPDAVHDAVPNGRLLHLHGSQDWAACLNGIAPAHIPTAITLHDCSLLTGGCPYPLDCSGIFDGCYDPCPRGFPSAHRVQPERLQAVRTARCHLISPSRWLRAIAKKVLPDISCGVIPNGVETPEATLTREFARNRLGVSSRARLVLFMAHGGEQAVYKFGAQWQHVWEEIRQRVDGALCFMVGGERHEQTENLIRWPYVDRERAQLFMAAADCFAYPTLADNHPLVVLEALSMGCPVVAYHVGGVGEQITHGQTGLLVSQGDWQEFSAACVAVLNSPSMRRNVALEGKARFLRHFTEQRMVADYFMMYAGLQQGYL